MRPATADCDVLDYQALLHPGIRFEQPEGVARRARLKAAEKRAILVSSLRSPAGVKNPVSIDEILEALCELDRGRRRLLAGDRLFSTAQAVPAWRQIGVCDDD